jgi:hypothetical protein
MVYVNVLSPDGKTNYWIEVANKFFETVAKFKYLETIIMTNQNCIHEGSKSGLTHLNIG